jgi:hypothetical protein
MSFLSQMSSVPCAESQLDDEPPEAIAKMAHSSHLTKRNRLAGIRQGSEYFVSDNPNTGA